MAVWYGWPKPEGTSMMKDAAFWRPIWRYRISLLPLFFLINGSIKLTPHSIWGKGLPCWIRVARYTQEGSQIGQLMSSDRGSRSQKLLKNDFVNTLSVFCLFIIHLNWQEIMWTSRVVANFKNIYNICTQTLKMDVECLDLDWLWIIFPS